MPEAEEIKKDKNAVNVQRAVIIGLGGTGAEVIRRLRRLIVDRYGSFEALPIVRFLYIDTDINWFHASATEVEEDIRLAEAEVVDATVADATPLYQGIAAGNYPHYGWFTLERLKSHTNITAGAGTIRQLGRLCFWRHSATIRERLGGLVLALNADANATYMQDHHNQQVDPGINVHIIAGLVGGTGSGCFLDMAYLARDTISTLGIEGGWYAGYLILPGAYADLRSANALPNGYAALKELNYLNYRHGPNQYLAALFGEPAWRADYAPDGSQTVAYKNQAPFEFCYLLDNSNESVQVHRNDIFAMLARSLFHEFTSEFSRFKRSFRQNIANQTTSNDPLDCPAQFMSFGQSAVYFPVREVKEVLAHQLALRAVQQWVDRTAEPINVLTISEEGTAPTNIVASAMASLNQTAESEEVVGGVKGHLTDDFLRNQGFAGKDVLTAIVADAKMRLRDVPYQLREQEKQRWINERWARNAFQPHLTDAWTRWRGDFGDQGPDPLAWGERIRWIEGNRAKALKTYRRKIYDHAMQLFHDVRRGPAWSLAFVRQMQVVLTTLRDRFINEANSPLRIAEEMGDIVLINAASQSQVASLSEIIERRIGEEYQELDQIVRENWFTYLWGGEGRLRAQAYEYLTWCAHWCRARVEERARRLAADLCNSLLQGLPDLERQLLQTARTLAAIQERMTRLAREWAQKGATTENVGKLLYDPIIVRVLEQKIAELRGDRYDPVAIGEKALAELAVPLEKLSEADVPKLRKALLKAAEEALGDLTEKDLTDTQFAAHDLLSAQYADRDDLNAVLRTVIAQGNPFVRLNPTPPEGPWGNLVEECGAGIRGGWLPDDLDQERARVLKALERVGTEWNPANVVKPIGDSEQIVFAQECGGYPLRALVGIREMKDQYEAHRSRPEKPPLHIVRDELAERFPDVFPPSAADLARALALQTVGLALELIAPHDFPNPDGSGKPLRLYAYLRPIPATGETHPEPVGDTPAAVGLKLAYDTALAKEIQAALDAQIRAADDTTRTAMTEKLKAYLQRRKEEVDAAEPTLAAETNPVYTGERDRVVKFMTEKGLS